jgi:hypothetical protein
LQLAATAATSAAIGCDRLRSWLKHDTVVVGNETGVVWVGASDERIQTVETGFLAHSFLPDPHQEGRVWALSKFDKQICEVDLNTARVVRTLRAENDFVVYGHGAFSRTGDILWTTQLNSLTGAGHIVGYDRSNFKIKANHRVSEGVAHDCKLGEGETLLVATSGVRYQTSKDGKWLFGDVFFRDHKRFESSAVTTLDLKTGQIKAKSSIEQNDVIGSHMGIAQNGNILLASAPFDGKRASDSKGRCTLFFLPGGQNPKPVVLPEEALKHVNGQMLGIAIDEKRRHAAVTIPSGPLVFYIDVDTGKYQGHVAFPARGVGFSQELDGFVFNSVGGVFRESKTRDKFNEIAKAANLRAAHMLVV